MTVSAIDLHIHLLARKQEKAFAKKKLNYSHKSRSEESPKKRGGKTEKCFGQVELTAIHLIAHVATVIPAITLQLFSDADARCAGKLIGASCMNTTKMKRGSREIKRGDRPRLQIEWESVTVYVCDIHHVANACPC